jgi:hypothetical protein
MTRRVIRRPPDGIERDGGKPAALVDELLAERDGTGQEIRPMGGAEAHSLACLPPWRRRVVVRATRIGVTV